MTRDEAIKELTELLPEEFLSEYAEAIRMAIKALQQQEEYITKMDEVRRAYDNISRAEPCEDAVSRQAVLEVIRKCHCEEWVKADIGAPIEVLPSVTPQPKMGRWTKEVSDDPDRTWDRIRFYCSVCNHWNTYGESKYCPDCGARMEKENE